MMAGATTRKQLTIVLSSSRIEIPLVNTHFGCYVSRRSDYGDRQAVSSGSAE